MTCESRLDGRLNEMRHGIFALPASTHQIAKDDRTVLHAVDPLICPGVAPRELDRDSASGEPTTGTAWQLRLGPGPLGGVQGGCRVARRRL